ncbi:hypothetical protein NDU88_000918 [Pleurodeles waltl]|uniref:Uncharacterized protein n=1 Tax=Pleurodeles waltl TaxID=8319 RepID=A0AAV7ML44_PLEWA|nr:hypothetical protein NDU88_000918 [Pleurodeles waltl]
MGAPFTTDCPPQNEPRSYKLEGKLRCEEGTEQAVPGEGGSWRGRLSQAVVTAVEQGLGLATASAEESNVENAGAILRLRPLERGAARAVVLADNRAEQKSGPPTL